MRGSKLKFFALLGLGLLALLAMGCVGKGYAAPKPDAAPVGLNGPAVGLSAALIGFADFVYCTPSTFLLTPFSSLGLVAEGGASRALAQRLGVSKANEALIMSKKITAEELLSARHEGHKY